MEFSSAELKKAAQALSERYRTGQTPYLRTPQDRYAYLLTRYPATKAALHRVFQEIRSFPIQTMLDIGAGPGTSWEAACETWENVKATLMERDRDFVEIGSKMTPPDRVRWVTGDVSKQLSFEGHDLVLFSYSWGEILDLVLLERAWQAAGKFLVIVEPGTPRGYQNMLKARDFCISKKASVFAPCPHSNGCPWQNSSQTTQEWCHFGVRLQRSDEHRLAKEGALGFEDEKYSYVVLSKESLKTDFSRLLKDPLRRKGHTVMTLCSKNGIEQKTVTKKDKEFYKKINKLKWGDKITNKV